MAVTDRHNARDAQHALSLVRAPPLQLIAHAVDLAACYSRNVLCIPWCLSNNVQRQLHEERVAALLADRQLRAQEEERQRANLAAQVRSAGTASSHK
jgi:hypothetical protein